MVIISSAAHVFTPREEALLATRTSGQVVGDPGRVLEGLRQLVEQTGAAELMITTLVHGHADRLRSYELTAAEVERDERGAA